MAGGGLYDPLGTDRPTKAPRVGPSPALIALLVVLIGLASLFGMAAFHDGGERGEPRAVAEIGPVHHDDPAPPSSPSLASANSATLPAGSPGGTVISSDQEVEIQNGVRVIRPRRDGSAVGSLVVKVPDSTSAALKALAVDNRLLEPGPSGPLPRIASDGRKPSEVYAGSAVSGSAGKPWVAIVVRGLGIDPVGTAQAPTAWPAGVTLGFAVDGTDLSRQVGTARAAGHEVVLTIPPSTEGAAGLAGTTASGPSVTAVRDRLRWQLSRFTGYAGVVIDSTNLDAATVAADVAEMTRRGLYVVDSVPARSTALPLTTVDATLTGSFANEAPDRFLDRLLKLARSNGSAIGIATASPQNLAAISTLATTLADRGIALVPLSAVVSLRQSAQARPIPVAAP